MFLGRFPGSGSGKGSAATPPALGIGGGGGGGGGIPPAKLGSSPAFCSEAKNDAGLIPPFGPKAPICGCAGDAGGGGGGGGGGASSGAGGSETGSGRAGG